MSADGNGVPSPTIGSIPGFLVFQIDHFIALKSRSKNCRFGFIGLALLQRLEALCEWIPAGECTLQECSSVWRHRRLDFCNRHWAKADQAADAHDRVQRGA